MQYGYVISELKHTYNGMIHITNIFVTEMQDSQLPEDSIHDIARDLLKALQYAN